MGALIDAVVGATRRLAPIAGLTLGLLVACGSDGGGAAAGRVSVSDAWSLATVTGQPNGAVYFTILSTESDTLQRIEVPASIAGHATIHETVTNADGAMTMHEMESGVSLEPGTAVTFTPGGSHVMLVDLVQPLSVGEAFDVTLEFAKADPITLRVAVVESAP